MSQNLVIIYATVRHDKKVLLYRSLVLRNEPEGEQIRGLLATHADKSGPLVVQALVRLLASHADKSGPGGPWAEDVLSEIIVQAEVVVVVVVVAAVVLGVIVLLASHADEASPLELVHVLEKISQSVFRFRPLFIFCQSVISD